MKKKLIYFVVSILFSVQLFCSKPKLTVVVVIDQFGYYYVQKLSQYFTGGIKYLLDKGVVYTNAYHPHAIPATGTGYTALNTGVYAKDHGIIRNDWYNEEGKRVTCDQDDTGHSIVLNPKGGEYNYGKSPHNIMVDGITDQFILQATPKQKHYEFSFSIKTRTAIATANKLGKAIFFDGATGLFTSSKHYYDELPKWVIDFNQEKKTDELKEVFWKSFYKKQEPYSFYNTADYRYVETGRRLVDTLVPIEWGKRPDNPFYLFKRTPHASQLLFDIATRCIDEHITKNGDERMLLWLCIDNLDKLAHLYGPENKETIDLIYHIDDQLRAFIEYVHQKIGKKEVLWVLTADHGISPIPELLKGRGIRATRVDATELIQRLNNYLAKKHQVANLVQYYKSPQFFFDWKNVPESNRGSILCNAKRFLEQEPYIRYVWTVKELQQSCYSPTNLENYFKEQLFPGRSGDIIVQVFPYTQISSYPKGTDHVTPYNYDTHVPLIVCQDGMFEKKRIAKKVWMLQLANTLSEILEIPKPSASTFEILPELFT